MGRCGKTVINAQNTKWTRAAEERVQALLDEGFSYSEIAIRLRDEGLGDWTKNAVLGKAYRLNLRCAVKPKEMEIRPMWSGRRPIACQWIEGTPSRDDACKCGAPVAPNAPRPYCQEHLKRSSAGSVNLEDEMAA